MADHPKLSEIQARYRDRARHPETYFLLSAGDALSFLDELEKSGIGLLGVEAFRTFPEGGVQPLLEFSNDIADHRGREDEFLQVTRDLIERGGERGLFFEIVTRSYAQ